MEDIRVRKNKKLIKKALVNNFTGRLQDVTVSKLCQLSGVSRTAFYSYYPGVYAIVEELRQEFLPFEEGHPITEAIFVRGRVEFALENRQEYLFLLSDGVCRDIFSDTVRAVIHDMLLKKDRNLKEETFEHIASYAVSGLVSFYEYAIDPSKSFTVDEMMKMYQIIENNIYGMLDSYKK